MEAQRKSRKRPRRPERQRTGTVEHRARVGQSLVLDVGDLTLGGEAVARYGQYVLFIAGAMPGERVVAEVVSVGPRYGRARIVRVMEASTARVTPRCRHFGVCGGCAWQHIAYPEQLRWKERLLRSALEHRLPGLYLPIAAMIGMDNAWGTRNKVHFLIGEERGHLALGHYRAHSRAMIPVQECPVHDEAGNRVARTMLRLLDERGTAPYVEGGHGGIARHAVVRVAGEPRAAQAVLGAARGRFRGVETLGQDLMQAEPVVSGIHLNVNAQPGPVILGPQTVKLAGQPRLVEEIAGIKFYVSPTAFFQTSTTGAARLAETVLRYVPEATSGSVLDLYAGVGLFAAPLARRGHSVLAVEENPHAVQDGIETLRANHISGCRFLSGKAETTLKKLARDESFEVVILDPPREGCPEWALRLIAQRMRPARIIDVSCDPTTLARDLALLTGSGYRIREIQPIDMFPHTAHIESVALVERSAEPGGRVARAKPGARGDRAGESRHDRPDRRARVAEQPGRSGRGAKKRRP